MKIQIAAEYTKTPGGRFISGGKFSGEDFCETILEPRFLEAEASDDELEIDLDGGYGYGTSFLEEAFGGLAQKYPDSVGYMIRRFRFKSDDEPQLCEKIPQFIKMAVS
jgi:hypothetical protein